MRESLAVCSRILQTCAQVPTDTLPVKRRRDLQKTKKELVHADWIELLLLRSDGNLGNSLYCGHRHQLEIRGSLNTILCEPFDACRDTSLRHILH